MKVAPQRIHCSTVANHDASSISSLLAATMLLFVANNFFASSAALAAKAPSEQFVANAGTNVGTNVGTSIQSNAAKRAVASASIANATPISPLTSLGTGDVISMQVLGHPEFDTTAAIAEDGTVVAPLVGNIVVSGLSTSAAGQKLATAYKKGQFIKNPQVIVLVKQSRSQLVTVFGEVRSPGRYVIDASTSVIDLLAEAGGTTERSGTVYLIRNLGPDNVERSAVDLRGLNDAAHPLKLPSLRAGDSMFVSTAEQFYIYGEVHAPNMYRLEPDMTVLQAISRGGGLTNYGSSRRIEIKRRNANGELVTSKVSLNERVQADDVIHIKESLF